MVQVPLDWQRKRVNHALHYLLWHFSSSKRCTTGDFCSLVEISTKHWKGKHVYLYHCIGLTCSIIQMDQNTEDQTRERHQRLVWHNFLCNTECELCKNPFELHQLWLCKTEPLKSFWITITPNKNISDNWVSTRETHKRFHLTSPVMCISSPWKSVHFSDPTQSVWLKKLK